MCGNKLIHTGIIIFAHLKNIGRWSGSIMFFDKHKITLWQIFTIKLF